ncbi:NAD(P)-dependent oxidoreductase [Citreimonas salinaria]|uniref:2-hydroxy-3-oxopropionate reductase n=1 Tax=Citreimonas salinaria TaxID=321339 RepID=A0A1H3F5W6_9RHOB|nr:NAD(P)-dependent oxidoreductase [Citreimonas salinaria]SDX85569.1 2-hydroxy-3-oxopropionate reductase [Citreimonas salinaria]
MQVTVLGTGLMGAPMARALERAGHDVRVWNRTRTKAEALELSATVCADPAVAVRGAGFVISMLSDGRATGAVLADETLRTTLQPGQTWIEMASARPEEARQQARDLAALGVAHLDAPVSGGTAGAEAGALAIMAGGEAETFAAARPVLLALGRPVHVGPSGAGMLAKLANQAIVGITIGAVAEATLLLERGGADPAAVRDALKGGFADSTILQMHGARMTDRAFQPGALCVTQLKDMENALSEAEALGLTLPMAQAISDRYARLIQARDEAAGLDHAALFLDLLDVQDTR